MKKKSRGNSDKCTQMNNICRYHSKLMNQKLNMESSSLCSPLLSRQGGELSEPVLSFLSASAEYHILDILSDASVFCSRGKRTRLNVDDVKASLELRGAEVRQYT